MNRIIITTAICLLSYTSKAQHTCPPEKIYTTNFLNDGKDSARLHLRLNFIFTADSIIVSFDTTGRNVFLAFKILKKECSWNIDFSEGKSIYSLMLGEKGVPPKYPVLYLIKNKEQEHIELLYENAEKRVLYPF